MRARAAARVGWIALDADERAMQAPGDRAGGARAEKRIEHEIAGVGGGEQHARQQRFGLLRRMGLAARRVLQPFGARADRQQPVGARLEVLVARLQRLVVERVALGRGVARRPDHRLMRVGEPAAAKIRHRIGLAPDDVVEDPEAEILHDRADAKNIVIGADHENRRFRLHHAPHGAEPGAGEGVVIGKARKLVPVVVDRVDEALVGARQRAFELQVVRRVGEHQVDAGRRQPAELVDAIADEDRVARRNADRDGTPRQTAASTRDLNLGGSAGRPGTGDTHERNHSTRLTMRILSHLSKSRVSRAGAPLSRFRTPEILGKTAKFQ